MRRRLLSALRCGTTFSAVGLAAVVLAGGVLVAACTPSLNWREVRIDDAGMVLLFPCKPERLTRALRVLEVPLQMALRSCTAEGLQFALAHAVVAAEAHASADAPRLLAALREAQLRNVDAVGKTGAATVGVPPASGVQRLALEGRRGDERVAMRLQYLSRDGHLFQASVVGPAAAFDARAEAVAVEFFDGLRPAGPLR